MKQIAFIFSIPLLNFRSTPAIIPALTVFFKKEKVQGQYIYQ